VALNIATPLVDVDGQALAQIQGGQRELTSGVLRRVERRA
jgi:hypothetical protein